MQEKDLEEVEGEDDLEEEEILDKRFEKFKEKKIDQIEKYYFSSIHFYKIPTFKKFKGGKFNEKKEEFDSQVRLLRERIIYNCSSCYYYGNNFLTIRFF
jgi:hypothetical protein